MVRVHDLLKLRSDGAGASQWLVSDQPLPEWSREFLGETPWVVVRRGSREQGIPVGIRGWSKQQRFGCLIPKEMQDAAVEAVVTPEQALEIYLQKEGTGASELRQIQALPWYEKAGIRMGLGGSVGFEMVTGRQVSRPGSDLDLLIDIPRDCGKEICTALWEELQTLPVRTDGVLVTGLGWTSLEEYVKAKGKFMVKTAEGCCLSNTLW